MFFSFPAVICQTARQHLRIELAVLESSQRWLAFLALLSFAGTAVRIARRAVCRDIMACMQLRFK